MRPVLPEFNNYDGIYPFFLRLLSEVTASDGSSSMASVCGSTLALLDAGVPIKRPVSGISIGLYADDSDDQQFTTVTDLLGMEDHFGKMDFKIASSNQGITAMQLDIKRRYITKAMVECAIFQAFKTNSTILEGICNVIDQPNANSSRAPYIRILSIQPHQKSQIIGKRRDNLNSIEQATRSKLHIDGEKLSIVSPNKALADEAALLIKNSIN
uniref:Uncharacterized protein n=1 Tax=Aplanochytrium stocchinoi TaxID=215587 RepID=A0A7S3LLZ2_9STRA